MDHGAPERFELVALAGGIHSLRSLTNSQTFHPVVGPAAEADLIHVGGTRLVERAREAGGGVDAGGEFVVWDVGLGAAANALAAIAALRGDEARTIARDVRLLSFDRSVAALDFAREHAGALNYSVEQREWISALRQGGEVVIPLPGKLAGAAAVRWAIRSGDFPALVGRDAVPLPPPHAIFFDPYSRLVNPEMWTLELFTDLRARLRSDVPCLLTTYTRSTAVRVTQLLAGFYVGVGRSIGEKDETTVATNVPEMLDRPLDRRWVNNKAYVSTNAAPLRAGSGTGEAATASYSRGPISIEDYARLQAHPQFVG